MKNLFNFRFASNKLIQRISTNEKNPIKNSLPLTQRSSFKLSSVRLTNNLLKSNNSNNKDSIISRSSKKMNSVVIKKNFPIINSGIISKRNSLRLSSVKTKLSNLSSKKLLFFNSSKRNNQLLISNSDKNGNQNEKKNKGKRFSVILSRNDNNVLGFTLERSTNNNNNKFKTNTNLNLVNNNNNDSLKNLYFRENRKMRTLSKMNSDRNIDKNFSKFVKTSRAREEKEKDSNNPFQIEEEDKIFKKLMKKKKKRKKKLMLQSHDNPLSKVYKRIPYILTKLNEVKKQKNDMSLLNYQNRLLEVGSKVLKRDVREKLNKKFIEIRKVTEKKYDYFERALDSIEDQEKEIINRINTQQNFFKRIMIENNKESLIYGLTKKHDFFPRIKFYPTPKNLLYNNY